METLDLFIEYLIEQVNNRSIFVWGAQGQKKPVVCERWIRKREDGTGGTIINHKYETYADIAVSEWEKRVEEGYGEVLRAFDCSGLGVYFFLAYNLIKNDMSANSLYGLCTPTNEPKRGYWLFRLDERGRATHIGFMINDHEVVHAKGRQYGVVREKYKKKDGYWHKIGIPKIFNFDPEPEPTEPIKDKKIKIKGTVHVRTGNGRDYPKIGTAKNEMLPYLGQAEEAPYWYRTIFKKQIGYITSKKRYTEVVDV